jgi:tRNA A-37 threonylcarbamoyl transferase component Bud32
MHKRLLYVSSPEWAATADRIEQLIGGPGFRAVKAVARTSAGFLRAGDGEAFVKRVEVGSWFKGILDRIRGSRAARALRGAEILESAGFAHPRPIAAVEVRSLGAVRESYILSEPLRSARILSEFALADGRNFQRRQWVSERVAHEIRRLHDAGLYTLDMQETNLMLESHGDEITVYFIDLEDFRRVREISTRRRMLNLVHLDRSIGRFISQTRRLRFFCSYLDGKPGRDKARKLVARMLEIRRRLEAKPGRVHGRTDVTMRLSAPAAEAWPQSNFGDPA